MNDRILLIIKTQNLTSSQFADEICVQRSNISHILSGRNNPSLEFVTKIIKRFPDLSLEWLIFGKGSMYKDRNIVEEKPKNNLSINHTKQIDLFTNIEEVGQDFVETKPIQNEIFNPIVEKEEKYSLSDELSNNFQKNNITTELLNEKEENIKKETIVETNLPKEIVKKKIEKIVIFYNDRTFREYFEE